MMIPFMHDHPAETHELKLDGLHCASCAANVESTLQQQPGVSSVVVSLTQARATVTGGQLEELIGAVRSAGYGAEEVVHRLAPAELRSDLERRQADNERQWKRRAVIGLSIWIPMFILHWSVEPSASIRSAVSGCSSSSSRTADPALADDRASSQ